MALPLPALDNTTFDELVTEGQSLIPRLAPAWTDHNTHDPGITLIEMLAWIAEMDSYRLDRISEASQRTFLRLVGVEPKPAQVAETVLVVRQLGLGSIQLPAGTQFTTGSLVFQTASPLWISKAALVTVLAGPMGRLTDVTRYNAPTLRQFQPFGSNTQPECALYLGFDQPLADTLRAIRLHIWVGDPAAEGQTRACLQSEWQARKDEDSNCHASATTTLPDWTLHYSVRTRWEFYAGGDEWLALTNVTDDTRALTLSGEVTFDAPDPVKHQPGGIADPTQSGNYFIRCRLTSGSYDCPPAIRFIEVNTIPVRHAADIPSPISLGFSNGQAGQTFSLHNRPIVPDTTVLKLNAGTVKEEIWEERRWWDRVGPYDHAYVLDAESGEVTFGNGRCGAVPVTGATISISYQVGGGLTGNVPATSSWSAPAGVPVVVSQPFSASGGADAEALFDTKARAVDRLTSPQRAVTLADFERLALETPGVPIARAKALADFDPQLHCIAAPGSVTVVVISKCAQSQPVPGSDFLRAIQQHLERRRLLSTEMHIIGPDYTVTTVQANLHATPDVVPRDLIALAIRRLNTFFDPLEGGPEGFGWPMGRAVYRTEILALLNALPGVLYVDGVILETEQEVGSDCCSYCSGKTETAPASCGNVEVCPHGLITPGQHRITVTTERVAP